MAYAAAALFFAVAMIVAASVIHMTLRSNWPRILAALRGELGIRQPAEWRPEPRMRPRPAAF